MTAAVTLPPLAIVLSLVTSVIIPGAASLLSRTHWPTMVTALITMLLSAVSGFAAEWAHAGTGFDVRRAALAALGAYVVAALARAQLWAGTRGDRKLLAVGSKRRPRP